MKKLLMLSVALATLSMPAMAQNAITGTVTDTKGAPMPGAKVQIKGTNESVLTNMDGTFSIVTNKKNPKLRAEYAGWDATTKTGKDGMVIVETPTDTMVELISPNGMTRTVAAKAGINTYPVERGICIVRAAGQVAKLKL